MIELTDGYVIDEMSNNQYALKLRYEGMRKGKKEECYRTLSYHSTFEEAKEAFQRISGNVCDRGEIISLAEYERRLEAAQKRREEAANGAEFMRRFQMYVPVAKGKPRKDKIDVFISFFIPGKENAIKRDELTKKCVEAGLIAEHIKDKDRAMRKILSDAKREYSLTNDGDGEGYYRPTLKEQLQLDRNIRREDKKSISNFAGNKVNKALVEDYKHGRIAGDA